MSRVHRISTIAGISLTVAAAFLPCAGSAQALQPTDQLLPTYAIHEHLVQPHHPASNLAVQPARPDSVLTNDFPILAPNLNSQLTYYYLPVSFTDAITDQVAEILVDHYPTPPERPIYILSPAHQYRLDFDFSRYSDRSAPCNTDIQVSYSNTLSDAELGSIEVLITETYSDGSRAIFYGEAKFIADSPSGLTLQCQTPDLCSFPTIRESQVVFDTSADHAHQSLHAYNIGWEWPGWLIHTCGHTYNIVDPAEADIDRYFYPDTTPDTTPPGFLSQWIEWGIYQP